MPISRRLAVAFTATATLLVLSACVSTRVTGQTFAAATPPAKQVLIIVRSGKFAANNTASNLGQKNLDSLVPELVARLPVVFSQNGVPARAVAVTVSDADLRRSLRAESGERILIVSPQSATYNSQSGQELFLTAQLLSDAPTFTTVWQAQVRMGTMGFGKFDASVANDIAVQMLEQLRNDKMASVSSGTLRVQ